MVKDENTPSPTPREQLQLAERKGAEPGARGAWEGSDGTRDGHRAGKRIPLARDSSRTITRFQRPLQDPPASCHHGPHSSCLSCSPAPRPRKLLRAEGDLLAAQLPPLSPPPKATRESCGSAAPPQSRPSPPGASETRAGSRAAAKVRLLSVEERQGTLGCRGYWTVQAWHCGVKGNCVRGGLWAQIPWRNNIFWFLRQSLRLASNSESSFLASAFKCWDHRRAPPRPSHTFKGFLFFLGF